MSTGAPPAESPTGSPAAAVRPAELADAGAARGETAGEVQRGGQRGEVDLGAVAGSRRADADLGAQRGAERVADTSDGLDLVGMQAARRSATGRARVLVVGLAGLVLQDAHRPAVQ